MDIGPHGPFENVVVSETTTTTIRRRCVDGGWNLVDVVVAARAIRIETEAAATSRACTQERLRKMVSLCVKMILLHFRYLLLLVWLPSIC